jgi:hypothetical protein
VEAPAGDHNVKGYCYGYFTCHIVVGLDPEGRMYMLDLWRQQASSDVVSKPFAILANVSLNSRSQAG